MSITSKDNLYGLMYNGSVFFMREPVDIENLTMNDIASNCEFASILYSSMNARQDGSPVNHGVLNHNGATAKLITRRYCPVSPGFCDSYIYPKVMSVQSNALSDPSTVFSNGIQGALLGLAMLKSGAQIRDYYREGLLSSYYHSNGHMNCFMGAGTYIEYDLHMVHKSVSMYIYTYEGESSKSVQTNIRIEARATLDDEWKEVRSSISYAHSTNANNIRYVRILLNSNDNYFMVPSFVSPEYTSEVQSYAPIKQVLLVPNRVLTNGNIGDRPVIPAIELEAGDYTLRDRGAGLPFMIDIPRMEDVTVEVVDEVK